MKTEKGTDFFEIKQSPDTKLYLKKSTNEYNGDFNSRWPLYSLRPSINKVKDNCFGKFSTNPEHWPVKFEWDYARRWLLNGNTKSVLPDGPVIRDDEHVNTYA